MKSRLPLGAALGLSLAIASIGCSTVGKMDLSRVVTSGRDAVGSSLKKSSQPPLDEFIQSGDKS